MSGCAQWCPARTQMPSRPRISATSWGWMPSSAKEISAPRWSASGGPWSVTPGIGAQALERVGDELALVGAHVLHADALQEVDRGAEADGLGDVRRAGLELRRALRPARLLDGDRGDHVPAGEERRHGVQQLGAAVQDADAGRARRPCGRSSRRSRRPARARSTGICGTACAPSTTTIAPAAWARRTISCDRVDGPEHVGDVRDGDDLDVAAGQQGVELVEVAAGPRRRRRPSRTSAPRRSASCCQGTKLEWCSISVTTTRSPGPTLASPQA